MEGAKNKEQVVEGGGEEEAEKEKELVREEEERGEEVEDSAVTADGEASPWLPVVEEEVEVLKEEPTSIADIEMEEKVVREAEEGRGEEMEDSEATADGEASPRSPILEDDEVLKEEQTPITETEKEKEVVGEEEGGEEMEDSEATVDGEASPGSPVVEDEEEVLKEEQTPIADTEMETESEVVKSGSGSGGKRRRGRNPKASTPVKTPARKIVGEDVCFICLDGGDLVLCDRRFVSSSFLL